MIIFKNTSTLYDAIRQELFRGATTEDAVEIACFMSDEGVIRYTGRRLEVSWWPDVAALHKYLRFGPTAPFC